jgi:hypothetical protein
MKKVFGFLKKVLVNKTALYVAILVILAATSGYFYWQNKQNLAKLNNPNQASEQETKALTEQVGKLMDLPKDESPTVISVVDKEKVKEQAFFTSAENGDKVLVYTAAKKAILYSPVTGKIIEVGPVDIAPTTNFKVALYSATGDTSNLDAIESKLKESVTNLEYPIKELAKSKTDKVLVVDINGGKTVEAEQIAKILGGEVSALPKGEAAPAADFLVISGK